MDSIVREALRNADREIPEKIVPAVKMTNADVVGDSDDALRRIVAGIETSIKVVGAGGAGTNTIDRIMSMGIKGGDVICVNTDAQHLLTSRAPLKLLIGESVTGGIGAGNNPLVGEDCAKVDKDKIAKVLKGADMVFVTCGLGGGTGTGSIPVIAEVAKSIGALTIGVVTLPFTVEGKVRVANALRGLKKLKKHADTVIIIPNDKLLEVVPNLPLNTAFKVADELLANAVKGITEMVTKAGLINLDFADLRTVMKDGGTAMIGLGYSSRDSAIGMRAQESVEKALKSPLLDTNISSARGALVNIMGGIDMTLEEAQGVVKIVSESVDPDAQIIWGAHIDESTERNVIKTLVVLSGVKTPQYEELLENYVEEPSEENTDIELRYV